MTSTEMEVALMPIQDCSTSRAELVDGMSQLHQQEVQRSVTSRQGSEVISPSVKNPVGEGQCQYSTGEVGGGRGV